VYELQTISSLQLLVDIRILGQRILLATTPKALAEHLGACERSRRSRYWTGRLWTRADGTSDPPCVALGSSAPTVATAIAAAHPSCYGHRCLTRQKTLRSIIDADCIARIRLSYSKLGHHPSPVLCRVDVGKATERRRRANNAARWRWFGGARWRSARASSARARSLGALLVVHFGGGTCL
jgi:hypothetical protein